MPWPAELATVTIARVASRPVVDAWRHRCAAGVRLHAVELRLPIRRRRAPPAEAAPCPTSQDGSTGQPCAPSRPAYPASTAQPIRSARHGRRTSAPCRRSANGGVVREPRRADAVRRARTESRTDASVEAAADDRRRRGRPSSASEQATSSSIGVSVRTPAGAKRGVDALAGAGVSMRRAERAERRPGSDGAGRRDPDVPRHRTPAVSPTTLQAKVDAGADGVQRGRHAVCAGPEPHGRRVDTSRRPKQYLARALPRPRVDRRRRRVVTSRGDRSALTTPCASSAARLRPTHSPSHIAAAQAGVGRRAPGPAPVGEQAGGDRRLGIAVAGVHHGVGLDRSPRRRRRRPRPARGAASRRSRPAGRRGGTPSAGGSVE